ncbi:general secretion proteinD [Oceanicaulis sp. HTCC2633]|uniref:secretin N-terminal domain-containing protein n=1 Tax=Oceanicaulis sp. HTCC2633 TaxID=314254 RepID=UPI000066D46B|nr:secretin N-terminal domain-containing protein [Oceanicaulis sp. HTCC2633]EAP91277.1 general secretion proteinD [Oceanicaulis sp. HTCC2633]
MSKLGEIAVVGAVCLMACLWVEFASAQVQQAVGDEPVPQHEAPVHEIGRGEFFKPFDQAGVGGADTLPGGPFSLVYRNADIATVINQVLGEHLQTDFTIAPDVQGQVTLRMQDVATRGDALQNLRDVLAPLSISLIDRGDFIAVVRGGGQQQGASVILTPGQAAPAGAGVAMLSLEQAHPSDVETLLNALGTGAQVVLADDQRQVIVVRGEAAALTAASEALALMDVDWLDEISTSLIPLQSTAPSDLIQDIEPLLGPYASTIELIALDRISALAVLSARPNGIALVERWVRELDQPRRASSNPRQLVYTVRHADPEELVSAVRELLGYGQYGGVYGGNASGVNTGSASRSSQSSSQSYNDEDRLQISAVPSQNKIIARGPEARISEVRDLVELLDQPRAQVSIEAAIISVSLQDEFRFGVNWGAAPSEQIDVRFADNADGTAASVFPGFSATYLNTDIEATLNMLDAVTEIEVISRPNVMALHNQQAELQVGDQVPVITQSAVSVTNPDAPIVNQTAYRDTGVILSVTPHVRAGGIVEIDITQEVSSVVQTSSSGIDSPTIRQRRITSTLLVPSGQSVALGGLIATTRTTNERGVPVLRELPVVGRVFGSDSESVDRTELVILLKPTVITDPSQPSDVWLALPAALERLRLRLEEFQ